MPQCCSASLLSLDHVIADTQLASAPHAMPPPGLLVLVSWSWSLGRHGHLRHAGRDLQDAAQLRQGARAGAARQARSQQEVRRAAQPPRARRAQGRPAPARPRRGPLCPVALRHSGVGCSTISFAPCSPSRMHRTSSPWLRSHLGPSILRGHPPLPSPQAFVVKHFAGDVTYSVAGALASTRTRTRTPPPSLSPRPPAPWTVRLHGTPVAAQ